MGKQFEFFMSEKDEEKILPNHKKDEFGKIKTFYCSESIRKLLDDGYKIR